MTKPLIDSAELTALLPACQAWSVSTVASVGSTNTELITAAKAGAPEWTVLISDHQSAGKGRFDRQWVSPAGSSLATSVLLRPDQPAHRWGWLSLAVGLAVQTAIVALPGAEVTLKWPNDVLVGGHKICGILSERVETETGPAAVCGWGVNLTMTPDELPTPRATSLAAEGLSFDRTQLAARMLACFADLVTRWDSGADLRPEYQQRCGTIGREVKVFPDVDQAEIEPIEGIAAGVGDFGQLIVDTDDGTLEFTAGDVYHLR